jgi:hypothetical protein
MQLCIHLHLVWYLAGIGAHALLFNYFPGQDLRLILAGQDTGWSSSHIAVGPGLC